MVSHGNCDTLHPPRPDSSIRGTEYESSASALETRSRNTYSSSIRHRGLSPRIPQNTDSRADHEDVTSTNSAVDVDSVDSSHRHRPSPSGENGSLIDSETHLEAVPLTPRPEFIRHGHTGMTRESDLLGGSRDEPCRTPRLPPLKFSRSGISDLRTGGRLRVRDATRTSYVSIFDFFKRHDTESRPTKLKTTLSDSLGSRRRKGYSHSMSTRSTPDATRQASFAFLRSIRVPSMERLKSHVRVASLRSTESTSGVTSWPLQNRNLTGTTLGSSRTWSSSRTCVSTPSSLDSGRTYLLPGVDTTEKFTHRWAVPSSLRKLERRDLSSVGDDFRSIVPDDLPVGGTGNFDAGLGFERVGRWTTHKWCLLLSVLSVLGYSIAALEYTILTWYQTWDHADVMIVADCDVLILMTLCSTLLLLASLVGLTGTILNSRPLLAIYALILWPVLISLLSIGYISYKRSTFSLDRKLNMAWSKWYTDAGRAVIQDSLECCGFYGSTHEAVYREGLKGGCYPRTPRPGCKGPLLRFERANLEQVWKAAFSTAPMHLVNIAVCLLCANHVTRTFGTGLMPRAYRLKVDDVKKDATSLLERFVNGGGEVGGEGAKKLPPLMARTETGVGLRRKDKVYANLGGDEFDDICPHPEY